VLGLLVLTSCAPQSDEPADGITLLSPREQLVRLSVDLRGVHPTEEELTAIESHPGLYDDFVDRYLADPRYLDRMEEVFNYRFLTRNGSTYFDTSEAGLAGYPDSAVAASIADEPLKLLRHIVENDLPYSEIATADYTMSDAILGKMWDLDYPEGATGWQAAHYQDGRPHSGILTMNTIWQRYPSMGGNANRHRANAVSRMLLCDDYLSRPIVLNRANIDQLTVDPEEAIKSETCQSCHSSLDPFAAHFYGFFYEDSDGMNLRDATLYRPENEEGWRDYANKPPAYFGRPTANLLELGEALAADTRFDDCAVRTVWEGVTQRTATDADWSELQAATEAYRANGETITPTVRAIVTTREYRAARIDDPVKAERLATVKTASPAQLAGIIQGITGYRWTFSDVDGLTDPSNGLVVLAGGVDATFVTLPNYNPSVGSVFVQERLAQSAAWHVASHDLDPDRQDAAILLKYVSAGDTPDTRPEVFEAQIRELYLKATGIPLEAQATEPAELAGLWKQLYSVEASSTSAWAGVVSAVLRDPRVLFF
jgi:hypothetical protein